MAKSTVDNDMLRNIVSLIGALVIGFWAIATYLAIDLSVYLDIAYIQYIAGGTVLIWGLFEMMSKGKYDGYMNIIALVVSGMAVTILFMTYYVISIPANLIYVFAGGSVFWMFGEWIRGE